MTRGQRLALVLDLRDRLLHSSNAWEILSTFEISAEDAEYNEGPSSYFFRALSGTTDPQLAELANYLGTSWPEEQTPIATEDADSPWVPGFFRLFLSHSTADKRLVSSVKAELADYGIDGFVAHEDILPTKKWQRVIEHCLRTCDAFAAFLSDDFRASSWCDQEVGWSLARGIEILSVRLDSRPPHGFLGEQQALTPARPPTPVPVAETLFTALRTSARVNTTACSRGLVEAFAISHTYAEARRRVARLVHVSAWNQELRSRVESAIVDNDQISVPVGVADRASGFINASR